MMNHKSGIKTVFLISSLIPVFLIGCVGQAQVTDNSTGDYQAPGITEESSLPVFYEKLAQRLTFPLSWTSGSYKDFDDWKIKAHDKVFEHLIYNPPPVPFDAVVLDKEDRGSYWAQKMVLNISADSRVLIYGPWNFWRITRVSMHHG